MSKMFTMSFKKRWIRIYLRRCGLKLRRGPFRIPFIVLAEYWAGIVFLGVSSYFILFSESGSWETFLLNIICLFRAFAATVRQATSCPDGRTDPGYRRADIRAFKLKCHYTAKACILLTSFLFSAALFICTFLDTGTYTVRILSLLTLATLLLHELDEFVTTYFGTRPT